MADAMGSAAPADTLRQCAILEIESDSSHKTLANGDTSEHEPKGTWLHAAYHLASATTGPQILSVPYAMAQLGWGPGLLLLCVGGAVSFYAYYVQILVTEHVNTQTGERCKQFRDLAMQILGPKWTSYVVAPLQFVVCFVTVVGCILVGGQTMKLIFQGQELSLYQFTIVFGCLHMLLSQLPSLHALRHLNLVTLVSNIMYCGLLVYSSIYMGISNHTSTVGYTLMGTTAQKVFGIFNSFAIISNLYGSVIIVEIHATIRTPSLTNTMKGLCLCYFVVLITTLPVAISGYWAFGSLTNGNVLLSIFPPQGKTYVPQWICVFVNTLIAIQLITNSLMYSQPTFAILEVQSIHDDKGQFTCRKLLSRILSRSIFTVFATLLAAMLPYFASLNALIGSLGFTPLVFVVPFILYVLTFRQSSRKIPYCIIFIFSFMGAFGCIASFRQLILEAKMYHLFANL